MNAPKNFGTEAPRYWARGLSAIPTKLRSKEPAIMGWAGYASAIPNPETQQRLLSQYSDFGIGVLTGKEVLLKKFLVGLDADDDRLMRLVRAVLQLFVDGRQNIIPGKRGRRGATYFVLVELEGRYKFTKLKGAGGLDNVDCLGPGRQAVMEGSIHPDTGNPYVIEGASLVETAFEDMVVIKPRVIELIGLVIGSEHAIVLVEGAATHDAGVALTAKLVAHGATDLEITTIIGALLPTDYRGDTLEELQGWIESARAKGFENTAQEKRANIIAVLIGLAAGDDVALCHDGGDTAYATVPADSGVNTLRIGGHAYERWLRNRAYRQLGKHVTTPQLKEAIAGIESMALHDGQAVAVHNRVGGDHQTIEIDLGTRDGQVVRITKDGWVVSPTASYKFVRGSGFGRLPIPAPGGALSELRNLLSLDEASFHLLLAFLINALNPRGPYFVLLVEGAQGSGKTFFCRTIKMIIDPNEAAKLRLPDNDRDLMIHAKEFRLLNYDNASGMKADISDALCSLATGGGIAVRRLYSDGELHVMSFCRPFVINGISGYAKRPDLMERAIPIKLQSMPEGARKTEGEMLAAFEEMLPRVLGALYHAVAAALRNHDSVSPPTHLRMADAAQWILASEEGLGLEPGAIIDAIGGAQTDLMVERINDEPVFIRLRAITAGQAFDGYMGELFGRLGDDRDMVLPKTPAALSQLLDRLAPAMAKAGILVEFFPKDRRGRRVRITSDGTVTGKSVPF